MYCRVGVGGVYEPRGEVKPGERITVSPDRQISLLRHVPHARPGGTFTPIEAAPGETPEAEAAAEVELTTAEQSKRFWLGRNDARLGVRKVELPGEPLLVMFGYERYPLGFSVKLEEFQRDAEADSPDAAACISKVRVFQSSQDSDAGSANTPLWEISANRPLQYGKFTFSLNPVSSSCPARASCRFSA